MGPGDPEPGAQEGPGLRPRVEELDAGQHLRLGNFAIQDFDIFLRSCCADSSSPKVFTILRRTSTRIALKNIKSWLAEFPISTRPKTSSQPPTAANLSCVCMYCCVVLLFVCVYIYIYTYAHYIYTHIYTYTHIHVYLFVYSLLAAANLSREGCIHSLIQRTAHAEAASGTSAVGCRPN